MAGHSKWANIKHRKGAQDAKRGKIFTKLIREITVSARMGGGGDPNASPRLRAAVDKALAANMTRDTIDRAIKRGLGGDNNDNLAEIRYEGYGPQGVAVMVDCLTDNKNRTVSEVRHAFNKYGGQLGTDGSVAYLFSKRGQIVFAPGADEDMIMEVAIDSGADDVNVQEDQSIEVVTSPDTYEHVLAMLKSKDLNPACSEVTMVPATSVELDKEASENLTTLIEALEDLDDVQEVYTNADFLED